MVSIVFGAYLLLLIVLNFQPTQQWLTDVVEESLSEKLNTTVRIGEVEVGLFNRVILHDVKIDDQWNEKLLEAGLVSAKIELAPLIHGEVSLRTISLLDANINLYANKTNEPFNFQFIVDAFSSKEKKEKKALNFRANSIILRRCNVGLDKRYNPETPGVLNLSHIGIQDLDANISLKKLTRDSLNLRIRSFAFKEKSGLDVRSLSLRMAANRERCDVTSFELRLPNSHLLQENVQANYSMKSASDFAKTLNVNGFLSEAQIATDDFGFLGEKVRNLKQIVALSSDFNINPTSIDLKEIHADGLNNRTHFRANVHMTRVDGLIDQARVNVGRLFVDSLTLAKYIGVFGGNKVPAAILNLGDLKVSAKMDYERDAWSTLLASLDTGDGDIAAHLKWKNKSIEGKADLNLKDFSKVLQKQDFPGKVVASVNVRADLQDSLCPRIDGKLHLSETEFRGYTYKDIALTADLKNRKLKLNLFSPNKAADFNVDFNADLQGKELSDMQFEGFFKNVNLGDLNLTDYFDNNNLSANVSASLKTFDISNPVASLQITDLNLSGKEPYQLKNLYLSAMPSHRGTLMKMKSDFGNARLNGPLSVRDFKMMLGNLLADKMPGIVESRDEADRYKWEFNVNLTKSDFFKHMLHLPLSFDQGINAEGYLSSNGNGIFVSAVANHLAYNKTEITNLRVLLREQEKELISRIQVNKRMGKRDVHFELENATKNGRLLTDLIWGDLADGKYNGVFKTETRFGGDSAICTKILPTHVSINDTLWNILPGEIKVVNDSVNINSIAVQHADQGVRIVGNLSKNPADSLFVSLKDIDVEYIMSMARIRDFSFSGLATGKVTLANTLDSLRVDAYLNVPAFHFNDGLMGHADIYGNWNIKDKRINIFGDIQEDGIGFTKVTGYVSPAEKQLDLSIESKNTNVYFLNRYVKGIFGNMQGRTSGTCRVYGPFKKIDFGGEEKADIFATVEATGVRYALSGGRVVMSPGKFGFVDFDLSDGKEGTGKLNGQLLHRYLKKLRYAMDVNTSNLLVYDKEQSLDMPFYATAYGTGKVGLRGKPGILEADIAMRPDNKTTFVYTVDSPESAGDVQFLRFVDAEDTVKVDNVDIAQADTKKSINGAPSMDIKLNFLIDMNPEATLKVIMDRKAGDHLIVHGYGPIRASFYNKGSFEMFGKLNVDRGVYKMSIQDVIRKDFEFTKGSYINFSGDPFMGDLGLRAIYTVNSASLADLNIGSNLSDNSVRVNCVLNFTGKVKSPLVSFDLELPTVSEDVQQMVRNLISSDEDMNMQILYLLGVGRFYTYNYSSTAAGANQSQSAVAMKSFLSNTLSSQLNNIISNAVGSSKWSFGANLSTGSMGWSDMEVEGLLSGRLLDNRLMINGNFGYRDRPTYSSTANFVGDFDVRYLLTPSGGVSLKAYSETNDRYFTKSSLTTQGIGLMLQRDFSNLRDLFRSRKKSKKTKDVDSTEVSRLHFSEKSEKER